MRVRKSAISGLFAMGIACVMTLCSCSSERSLNGIWSDTSGDYCVVFDESGSYRDSLYNIPLHYTLDSGNVSYVSPGGDIIYSELGWTSRGHLRMYIGGDYRELEQVDSARHMFDWSTNERIRNKDIKSQYTLMSQLGYTSDFCISRDDRCTLFIGYEGDDIRQGYNGLAALSDNSRDYVVYCDEYATAEILRVSPYGMYLGAVPLTADGSLGSEVSYSNQSLNQARGYYLDGVLHLGDSGVVYDFTPDSHCECTAPNGIRLSYNYFVSTEGLITLMPTDGIMPYDYMYYDADQNIVYRLAYQQDTWYDFVSELVAKIPVDEEPEVDWEISASLTTPSDRYVSVSRAYRPGAGPLYSSVPKDQLDYLTSQFAVVQEYLEQLQLDESLRKQHADEMQAERERILQQMQNAERGHARAQALMDARVEAEIANGVSGIPSTTTPTYMSPSTEDLSWLDEFLSNLENKSYDQGENPSSPVVNMDGGVSSETSVSATPTEPDTSDEEESGTEVSQFDPAFNVDFVCTCVNCYVYTLPVEFNADNVFLVDATVIEPGTCLAFEGYGMVTARASDGYTSGQTAVLYLNNHNAVNRFSSGTYNVYQVVG